MATCEKVNRERKKLIKFPFQIFQQNFLFVVVAFVVTNFYTCTLYLLSWLLPHLNVFLYAYIDKFLDFRLLFLEFIIYHTMSTFDSMSNAFIVLLFIMKHVWWSLTNDLLKIISIKIGNVELFLLSDQLYRRGWWFEVINNLLRF